MGSFSALLALQDDKNLRRCADSTKPIGPIHLGLGLRLRLDSRDGCPCVALLTPAA